MRIYYSPDDLVPLKAPVVTVGSFDGVHRGHKALLDATVARAARSGSDSVSVTFWPHPRKVLKPGERTWLLTTLPEKLWLLERSGISHTVVMPFDEDFSRMGYRDFFDRVIKGSLGATAMVVGYDHKFGHNKEGEYSLVGDWGVEMIPIPEQTAGGRKVSSTEVRRAVARGDMAGAADILGHPYMIMGTAASAAGGETALAVPDPDKLLPPAGRYEVKLGEGAELVLSVSPQGLILSGAVRDISEGEELLVSFL
ncbi:MAG: FAD synthetase family protein [Alistipes sp.]|nr:FAD synthetase family protein [Alistipes sp.]